MHKYSLSIETHQIIARNELGTPLEIYKPPTILNIISGIFVLVTSIYIVWMYTLISDNASSDRVSSIVSILFVFLFFLLVGVGCWTIYKAIYNRKMRVVVCTGGVLFIKPLGSESFRWQDVLTTIRSTKGSAKHIQHIYTVHCHDGRKFVFKELSKLHDLAESIDVKVAQSKQAKDHAGYDNL